MGTGQAAQAARLAKSGATRAITSGFESLIVGAPSTATFLLSLAAAAGFGMLHAFGPGHGKTLVAAYLVGRRGTPRHAVALGLTVTATHTAAVYALGGAAILASAFFLPQRLYLWLSVLSGVLVMAFGAVLFAQRVRARGRRSEAAHSHSHDAHDAHAQEGHDHSHDGEGASWRSVLTLGVLGGLLPCPSAIVVMLAAISLGQVLYGMLLIVAFSAGLAAVLTALGLVVVVGQSIAARLRARHGEASRFAARAQGVALFASPLAIALIGLALTVQAFRQAPDQLL